MAAERSDVPYSKAVELRVAVAVEQTAVVVATHCSGSIDDGSCYRGKGKKKEKKKRSCPSRSRNPDWDLDRRTDKQINIVNSPSYFYFFIVYIFFINFFILSSLIFFFFNG
jgi:hypothetical protein